MKDDEKSIWGIGILESNFEHIEAQKKLNRLRAKALEDADIAAVRPVINRLGEFCIRYPKKGQIERIIAESVRFEPVRYPEEVKLDAMKAQLRREMAKGEVCGHFH